MIREGDFILLKKEKTLKLVRVQCGRDIIIEKKCLRLDPLVGEYYGTTWELSGNCIVKIESQKPINQNLVDIDSHVHLDNSCVTDDNQSQKLSKDNIMKMKEDGISGEDIIDHLIENSTTFKEKTLFSQEKYIKKKKQKYIFRFSVLYPSTRILCDMYYTKGASKLLGLTNDSLAQMLILCNIHANSKVIVVESCQGLVLGAVMEKMQGIGHIVQCVAEESPSISALMGFNFPKNVMAMVHSYPLDQILRLKFNNPLKKQKTLQNVLNDNKSGETINDNLEWKIQSKKCISEKTLNKFESYKDNEFAKFLLESYNMDGLIVVSRFNPSDILEYMLDFLAKSRPFAVFSQFKEPLLDCFCSLRKRGDIINIKLTQTFVREYQTLQNRTHPFMMMNTSSGYILSGIKVSSLLI